MVSTNMTHNKKVNCFVKSASAFVCEALNTVGHSSYTSGCLSHALQVREINDCSHLQIVPILQHLNVSLCLPCCPTERGSHDTYAGLASYVDVPHQKATKTSTWEAERKGGIIIWLHLHRSQSSISEWESTISMFIFQLKMIVSTSNMNVNNVICCIYLLVLILAWTF